KNIARAGELATQAVLQRDRQFDLSLLLSAEAFHTADTTRTRSVLLDNTLTNPRLLRYLRSHYDTASSIALSPDGKTLASGSDDPTIVLWGISTVLSTSVANGQSIGQPLQGHGDTVLSVAFSPDGKTLASGSADGVIILWDVATRQPIGQPLKGHDD